MDVDFSFLQEFIEIRKTADDKISKPVELKDRFSMLFRNYVKKEVNANVNYLFQKLNRIYGYLFCGSTSLLDLRWKIKVELALRSYKC